MDLRMIVAIGLGLVLTVALVVTAWGSADGARSGAVRGLVVAGGLLAAALTVAVVWEALVPGAPLAEGVLARKGDVLELGDVGAGQLSVVAIPNEGVERDGKAVGAKLLVRGSRTAVHPNVQFRIGHRTAPGDDGAGPPQEDLETLVPVEDLGGSLRVELLDLAPPNRLTIRAAFLGRRLPFRAVAIALTVLAVLMSLFEATSAQSSRRSFVAVAVTASAALAWMLGGGITGEGAVRTVLAQLVWAGLIGGIAGTLLPRALAAVLPAPRARGSAPAAAPGLAPPDNDDRGGR